MHTKNSILTSINTLHMGIIWYTSDLHILTIEIYSSILPWQQGLENISAKYKWPGYDSWLHIDVCCQSLVSQFLRSWFLEVENTDTDSVNQIFDWFHRYDWELTDHVP